MIAFFRFLLRMLYGFRVFNAEVVNTKGPVLLLPNHVSWWDWLLLGVCLEKDWRFVTSSTTAQISWLHHRIMVNSRTFPVDINSPYAVKHMAEYLQRGGRLVLFPEGRISCTGSLMKLFEGTGFLIHKTHAKVITACLRGADRLPFSRNPNHKRWFPNISLHFSEIQQVPSFEGLKHGAVRKALTHWVRNLMILQRFRAEMQHGPQNLLDAVACSAREKPGHIVLQDATMKELSYRRLFTGVNLLAANWRGVLNQQRVGILLPNVNSVPVVLMSLWAAGHTPAILNYSVGITSMLSCCRIAALRQVITSRKFLEKAKLELQPLVEAGIELVFLEDVATRISPLHKTTAVIKQLFAPGSLSRQAPIQPDQTAFVLFTSGSEGEPKGVELTHKNVLSNIRQMQSVIDLNEQDRFFNALPLFHSFGLNIGLLLPLVHGSFCFLYLSPLHYRVIPSAVYNLNCTVLFGTNTFLSGYARKAHPLDFRTIRYVYAAAEKLQESTALAWMRDYGVRVLEGYGATECGPCLTVNLPSNPRQGSAGEFLPDIEHRLDHVEGVGTPGENVGRLLVRGPNIMRGYLNPEANAKYQAMGGWYDTGDIVRVDSDGHIYIVGRLKRFAKISGEMISLTAVEEALANAFPQYGLKLQVAVLSRPDPQRGERLIALTNQPQLTLEQVRDAIRARGLSNLSIPREVRVLPELPTLSTGKMNYRALEGMIP